MSDYFIGTQAECDALVSKLNTLLGYPNGNTLTYGTPRQYFSDANKWYVPVKLVNAPELGRQAVISDYSGTLTPTELTLITVDALKADGAWDTSF